MMNILKQIRQLPDGTNTYLLDDRKVTLSMTDLKTLADRYEKLRTAAIDLLNAEAHSGDRDKAFDNLLFTVESDRI